MQSFDVALLTDRRYTARSAAEGNWYLRNILDDDGLLQEALTRRGRTSLRVDWAEPEIDCSLFRCGRGFMGVAVGPGGGVAGFSYPRRRAPWLGRGEKTRTPSLMYVKYYTMLLVWI